MAGANPGSRAMWTQHEEEELVEITRHWLSQQGLYSGMLSQYEKGGQKDSDLKSKMDQLLQEIKHLQSQKDKMQHKRTEFMNHQDAHLPKRNEFMLGSGPSPSFPYGWPAPPHVMPPNAMVPAHFTPNMHGVHHAHQGNGRGTAHPMTMMQGPHQGIGRGMAHPMTMRQGPHQAGGGRGMTGPLPTRGHHRRGGAHNMPHAARTGNGRGMPGMMTVHNSSMPMPVAMVPAQFPAVYTHQHGMQGGNYQQPPQNPHVQSQDSKISSEMAAAQKRHLQAIHAYDDALTHVWACMCEDGWGKNYWKLQGQSSTMPDIHLSEDSVPTGGCSEEQHLAYADVNFKQASCSTLADLQVCMAGIAGSVIHFPSLTDASSIVKDVSSSHCRNVTAEWKLCVRACRMFSGQDSSHHESPVPTFTKYMFFVHGGVPMMGAWFSSELLHREGRTAAPTPEEYMALRTAVGMTAYSKNDGSNVPFMTVINTNRPSKMHSINHSQIHSQLTDEDASRYRGLSTRSSLDYSVPIPYMRMYLSLWDQMHQAGMDLKSSQWQMLGSLGREVSAYAVHLSDGSYDLVIGRMRLLITANEVQPARMMQAQEVDPISARAKLVLPAVVQDVTGDFMTRAECDEYWDEDHLQDVCYDLPMATGSDFTDGREEESLMHFARGSDLRSTGISSHAAPSTMARINHPPEFSSMLAKSRAKSWMRPVMRGD